MEMALLQLVVLVEKVLDQQETALDVFLNIEGALNNTPMTPCVLLFLNMWLLTPLYGGLELPWRAAWLRQLSMDFSKRVVVSRGFSEGGVLLPLLWCLVVDGLIAGLIGVDEDDVCLRAVGKFPNTVSGLIQWTLHTAETWCDKVGLSVNPDNTGLIVFTRKRKLPGFFAPYFLGVTLCRCMLVKYLAVVLDSRLIWREHVGVKVRKAHNMLWACGRACGVTWGLRP